MFPSFPPQSTWWSVRSERLVYGVIPTASLSWNLAILEVLATIQIFVKTLTVEVVVLETESSKTVDTSGTVRRVRSLHVGIASGRLCLVRPVHMIQYCYSFITYIWKTVQWVNIDSCTVYFLSRDLYVHANVWQNLMQFSYRMDIEIIGLYQVWVNMMTKKLQISN